MHGKNRIGKWISQVTANGYEAMGSMTWELHCSSFQTSERSYWRRKALEVSQAKIKTSHRLGISQGRWITDWLIGKITRWTRKQREREKGWADLVSHSKASHKSSLEQQAPRISCWANFWDTITKQPLWSHRFNINPLTLDIRRWDLNACIIWESKTGGGMH